MIVDYGPVAASELHVLYLLCKDNVRVKLYIKLPVALSSLPAYLTSVSCTASTMMMKGR